MLALASALSTLETDPSALGKRYQLASTAPPSLAGRGCADRRRQAAAAPRYEVQAADSFALDEAIDVIAYPGRSHGVRGAAAGRRARATAASHQAEVGEGLAQALGLGVGSTLALALPSGIELRLRVSGIVSSLQHDGRVAYIPASALLPAVSGTRRRTLAVRLTPSADVAAVEAAMTRIGAPPVLASGATARGAPLVNVLRTILRAVAIVDGLVCLYALIQACALTVLERRRTVAVLRACGAGAGAVRRLLLGSVLALVVPAAVVGVAARAVRVRSRADAARRELRDAAAERDVVGRGRGARPGWRWRRRSRWRGWRVRRSASRWWRGWGRERPGGSRGGEALARRAGWLTAARAGRLRRRSGPARPRGPARRCFRPGATRSATPSCASCPASRWSRGSSLAPRAAAVGVLATLAHVTDAHVLDASSPARVTFLDRLGAPFESTFRPQEALTAQVLAGAVAAVRALAAAARDPGRRSDRQRPEQRALAGAGRARGGLVRPGSGPRGYYGVQLASDPDPFYYRPDVDAPQHPGLLRAAVRPFVGARARRTVDPGARRSRRARRRRAASRLRLTASLAVGDRALWDLPRGVAPPPGTRLTTGAGASPDGPPQPLLVDQLLTEALRGPTVRVPGRSGAPRDVVRRGGGAAARAGAGSQRRCRSLGAPSPTLDYAVDVGARLRLIVLDLVRRAGGSGGLVAAGPAGVVGGQLAAAGESLGDRRLAPAARLIRRAATRCSRCSTARRA